MLTSYVDDVYLDNLARDLFMRYEGTQAKRTWMVYKWREPLFAEFRHPSVTPLGTQPSQAV